LSAVTLPREPKVWRGGVRVVEEAAPRIGACSQSKRVLPQAAAGLPDIGEPRRCVPFATDATSARKVRGSLLTYLAFKHGPRRPWQVTPAWTHRANMFHLTGRSRIRSFAELLGKIHAASLHPNRCRREAETQEWQSERYPAFSRPMAWASAELYGAEAPPCNWFCVRAS